MGDLVLLFRSKDVRERAEKELKGTKDIVEIKKVGESSLRRLLRQRAVTVFDS